MAKFFLLFSSISGMIAVGLGAFGAHALKARLEETNRLETYQTAVQYQFIHTLALLGLGILVLRYSNDWLVYSGYAMITGIMIFSGSLYLLCFTGMRWLGAVTPLGGLFLILGWLLLTIGSYKITGGLKP